MKKLKRRYFPMGEEKITREISQGVKYPLTQELREDIQQMRLALDFSTDTLSALINLKKETYNNLEKKSSKTKTITSEVLDKLFEVFYNHSANQQGISREEFIIYHLEKFMSNPNTVAETLDQQYWLMALYLKYQSVSAPPSLFSERELRGRLQELSESNKHIKLKTDITIENEVYIALNEKKYAPLGNHPYWCIRYSLTEEDIESIVSDYIDKGVIRYSLLFSLMVVQELESRRKKDYNDVFSTVYSELEYLGIESIFDKIERAKGKTPLVAEQRKKADTTNCATTFSELLENINLEDCPQNVVQLIKNCVNGGDNFLDSINVDFAPLYNATNYDIEVFKIRLRELIDKLFS